MSRWRREARGRGKGVRAGVLGSLVAIGALIAPLASEASTYRWQVDANGNWNDPGNWALVEGPAGAGYPNLPGDIAQIENVFSESRVITIPTGVTVTVGEISVDEDQTVMISPADTGDIIFDNGAEQAVVGVSGILFLGAAIQLNSDVVFARTTNPASITIRTISEAGGARNVIIDGPLMNYGLGPKTYTGSTTVRDGSVSVGSFGGVQIPGSLTVGDGTGAAASASITVGGGGAITPAANPVIQADGRLRLLQDNMTAPAIVGAVTINDGQVMMDGNGGEARMASLTMTGGRIINAGAVQRIVLLGNVTATSSAAGTAVIELGVLAKLVLGTPSTEFIVADGPQSVDLQVFEQITFPSGGGGEALTKSGAGVAVFSGLNTYTGPTTVAAGTLVVSENSAASPFNVTGGILGGVGTVGPLTAANGGTVAPGPRPGEGMLTVVGNVNLQAGSLLVADIGGLTGASDQLRVFFGTVTLGGGLLDVNAPLLLPPNGIFTIIDNDGTDPVAGSFVYAEGSDITLENGVVFRISYVGGDGNDVTLTNVTPITYFLSEGATGSFFDEDVLIANPNAVEAPVTMTFFLPGGGTIVQQRTIAARSRVTVKVDEIPGLEATTPSVRVTSDNRLVLAVERTMFWDGTHYGGHTANAVPRPQSRWHFAEGSQGFFETYLLLGNPNTVPIEVQVTWLRETEAPVTQNVSLPPASRVTVYAGDNPELVGRSFGITANSSNPFTADRAMYFASTPTRLWSGGHANVGVDAPAWSWFHAEGASGGFFSTFILMSNPQTTAANVTLRFLLSDGGAPIEITKTIQPQQRLTVNPATEGISRLENAAFSTVVTSDVAIVSERAMYWPTDVPLGEGHASSGVAQTARQWGLAEGRVGGPNAYTTYILLANPDSHEAHVNVTFLRETGAPVVKTYVVPGNSRFNVDVGVMVPELQNESFGASVQVLSATPIVVERSMYWDVNGVFWQGGSNALAEPMPLMPVVQQ